MDELENGEVNFSSFGKQFQEKLAFLIMQDPVFANQIGEVLDYNFFELKYLRLFTKKIFDYKNCFGKYPSQATVETILRSEMDNENEALQKQVREFYARFLTAGNTVDDEYVKKNSVEFCKKQKLKEAMIKSVELLKQSSFDEIRQLIDNAIKLGTNSDFGYSYDEHFEQRYELKARNVVSTGWDVFDSFMRGGLGRGELGVVVAPTGCHAKGTKILMSDGHFKNVEDVRVGDELMGPDSTPRKVLHLHRGNEEMYKVVPTKGKPFIVNKGHILSLMDASKNVKNISVFEILNIQNSANKYLFDNKYKLYKVNLNNSKFTRTGFSLSPVGAGDYYGFEVDGDNLYIMEDFFVTHNSGKSFVLVHLGAQAVKAGKTVLHYTLELDDKTIGLRYDSAITGIPLDALSAKKDIVFEKIKDVKGKLIIKEYPTKSASTSTIRNHLEKMRQRGIEVGMIIVDYGDLLKPVSNRKEKREELESIYEELRGLAKETGCPIWTASQTNRCFSKNTTIYALQEDGSVQLKTVDTLRVGDKVETAYGYREIVDTNTSKQKTYTISLKNGKQITVSSNHQFPTKNGLISIDTGLKIGDMLLARK